MPTVRIDNETTLEHGLKLLRVQVVDLMAEARHIETEPARLAGQLQALESVTACIEHMLRSLKGMYGGRYEARMVVPEHIRQVRTDPAGVDARARIASRPDSGRCECGQISTGWTEIKCCNLCGFPHEDEAIEWTI